MSYNTIINMSQVIKIESKKIKTQCLPYFVTSCNNSIIRYTNDSIITGFIYKKEIKK